MESAGRRLHRWINEYDEYGKSVFPGHGNALFNSTYEIKKLVKLVKELEMENNLLKKLQARNYRNMMLILLQMPQASFVAGYQTWKKENHRQVVEKCTLRIIAPAGKNRVEEYQRLDPVTKRPMLDTAGNPVTEVMNHRPAHFQAISVWDISQTEGEAMPLMESGFDLAAIPYMGKWVHAFQRI